MINPCLTVLVVEVTAQTAHALQDVNRRVMIAYGQITTQHDVPIKNRSNMVGYRVVEVIPFYQNGEQSGDRSGFPGTGSLKKSRELGENRRRIAFGRRELTRGQADFPLGHGKASH